MPAKPPGKGGWDAQSWLYLRSAVQIIAFLGFIILSLNASQVLMGLDPLAMLANLIASHRFELLSVIAFVPIALALIFGRAWCGWLCPLGTTLEWFPFTRWLKKQGQAPGLVEVG